MYYGAWSIDCILRSHDGMTGSGWGGYRSSGALHSTLLAGSFHCMRDRSRVRWRFLVIAVHFSFYMKSIMRCRRDGLSQAFLALSFCLISSTGCWLQIMEFLTVVPQHKTRLKAKEQWTTNSNNHQRPLVLAYQQQSSHEFTTSPSNTLSPSASVPPEKNHSTHHSSKPAPRSAPASSQPSSKPTSSPSVGRPSASEQRTRRI